MAKTWYAVIIIQQQHEEDEIRRISQDKPFSADSLDELEELWSNPYTSPQQYATVTNIFTTEDD